MHNNKLYQSIKVFFILLVISAAYIPAVMGQAFTEGTANANVQSIPPVPAFNPAMINIQRAVNKAFNGQGRIDEIDNNAVIIDDIGRHLADPAVISGFSVGQYVGYKLNASGQITEIEPLTPPDKKRGH